MKNVCRSCFLRFLSTAVLLVFLVGIWMLPDGIVMASPVLSLTLTRTNSWEESGKTRSQYSATIKNEGTSAAADWKITITVPEGSSMGTSDGWNGVYSISGTILTITPKDYNKQIAAGGKTSDIGFILTTLKAVGLTGSVTSSGEGSSPSTAASASSPASQGSTGTAGSETQPAGSLPTDTTAAPAQDDWLHTDGNKILDKNGTAVWLTGINWFGYNTGTNVFDGVWSCNMQSAIASIADHGFNLLRIPISSELILNWQDGVFPSANFNQALNPELVGKNSLEIFDLAIAACKANGIKVMFDIHCAKTDSMGHMVNLWYTDTISTQDYYDSLSFLAKRYAKDDTVIAYDLKNEPHGKPGENGAIWNDSTSMNNWKNVAETAGNLVLDANPNLLIMIEGIEIYPKDIKENGDFSSTDSADYYFNWWGGNLRGVRDYPIDFGSKERNAQIVYSPHDYGPAVYAQPWFEDGFTYESLQQECWNDNWLYISKENIAPVLIGEWGGYMTQPNLTWMTYLRQLIADNRLNHTFWCFNANSGDTGGLVKDDFVTWDKEKYEFVKEVLWQQDGKFVGLDHVTALGKSGNGISLSAASGSAGNPATPSGSDSQDTSAALPSAGASDPDTHGNTGTQSETGTPVPDKSTVPDDQQPEWSVLKIGLAAGGMILILAGSVGVGYFTYTRNKKKGDNSKRGT